MLGSTFPSDFASTRQVKWGSEKQRSSGRATTTGSGSPNSDADTHSTRDRIVHSEGAHEQCLLGTFEPHTRLWSQILLTAKGNDMPATNEALQRAASPNARNAADAAEEVAENVTDFANDLARKAGKQFTRASNMATDVYEEAHEASKEYPHVTLALAAGFGFLLGVLVTRR